MTQSTACGLKWKALSSPTLIIQMRKKLIFSRLSVNVQSINSESTTAAVLHMQWIAGERSISCVFLNKRRAYRVPLSPPRINNPVLIFFRFFALVGECYQRAHKLEVRQADIKCCTRHVFFLCIYENSILRIKRCERDYKKGTKGCEIGVGCFICAPWKPEQVKHNAAAV